MPAQHSRSLVLLGGLCAAGSAVAQNTTDLETTGSHLGSTTNQVAIIQMSGNSEIDRILALIEAGDDEAALRRARAYVISLRGTKPADESLPSSTRYFALNALCIALTTIGDIAEALNTCSAAIELAPTRWTALNSRGTARFAAGRYAEALEDYRAARAVAGNDQDAAGTIDHNIALAEQRLSARE